MEYQELLSGIDFSKIQISIFTENGKNGRIEEQRKMLRKQRQVILEGIHDAERLLSKLDYLMHKI